jgi:hypothetical protein
MSFLEQRTFRFWTGAAFAAAAAVMLAASAGFGSVLGVRGYALAGFLAALSLRFLSYELKDPGFSRTRLLAVAAILTAILAVSFGLPDRAALPAYIIGALLLAGGTANDVWGLWREGRVAG